MTCGFNMHKKNRRHLENQKRENDRLLNVKEPLGTEVAKLKGKKTRNTTETHNVKKEGASRYFRCLLQNPVG